LHKEVDQMENSKRDTVHETKAFHQDENELLRSTDL